MLILLKNETANVVFKPARNDWAVSLPSEVFPPNPRAISDPQSPLQSWTGNSSYSCAPERQFSQTTLWLVSWVLFRLYQCERYWIYHIWRWTEAIWIHSLFRMVACRYFSHRQFWQTWTNFRCHVCNVSISGRLNEDTANKHHLSKLEAHKTSVCPRNISVGLRFGALVAFMVKFNISVVLPFKKAVYILE